MVHIPIVGHHAEGLYSNANMWLLTARTAAAVLKCEGILKTEAVHQLHTEALEHLSLSSCFSVYNFELITGSKMLPLVLYGLRNITRST